MQLFWQLHHLNFVPVIVGPYLWRDDGNVWLREFFYFDHWDVIVSGFEVVKDAVGQSLWDYIVFLIIVFFCGGFPIRKPVAIFLGFTFAAQGAVFTCGMAYEWRTAELASLCDGLGMVDCIHW